jgi:uncharacterized membrane protein YcaP (DUF421 family)
MEATELMLTAARAFAVYALMLVVIRALGKRTVGNFTAFDLLVALMLGEVVDEIIYGDVTFVQGTVAIVIIAAAEYGNSWLSYFDHGLQAILEGRPTVVMRHGHFDRGGMREERMNEHDVLATLRLQGITDVREVKLATVEVDGEVSVLRETWAETAQKADMLKDQEKLRKNTLGDEDEPPPTKATDSPYALMRKEG